MVLFSPTALHDIACDDLFLQVIVPETNSSSGALVSLRSLRSRLKVISECQSFKN